MGNYPKALSFFRLSEKLKDSIYSNEKMKELTQLELSYQFERQQYRDSLEFVKATLVQDKRISNQRIGLISIGFITFILATLALMIYTGKRKSDSLLLNILPEKVADELKRTGKSKATKFEGVTVIFTDFKGFTEMTEMLSAEDLVSEINLCFSEFDAIMSKYGIEKIKTIGDAYMAASGLPIPDPDHAIKAVDAAIEMVDFIAKRKSSLESLNKPAFEMRVGLNTGHVIAGIVGTKKFQYDIWGDTVNIASRMESGGEPGKVNISESTYTLVKERFKCIPRGKIKAKGKGEMEMYFVE
jgi:class 3 adenylate cyclase